MSAAKAWTIEDRRFKALCLVTDVVQKSTELLWEFTISGGTVGPTIVADLRRSLDKLTEVSR